MATKTTINISPKVLTATLTGLGLAGLGGITAAVTPDTFAFLGPWAPGAFAVATILLAQAAAWFKREQETAAKDTAPTSSTAPVVDDPVGWVGEAPAAAPAATAPLVPPAVDQLANAPHVDVPSPPPTIPGV